MEIPSHMFSTFSSEYDEAHPPSHTTTSTTATTAASDRQLLASKLPVAVTEDWGEEFDENDAPVTVTSTTASTARTGRGKKQRFNSDQWTAEQDEILRDLFKLNKGQNKIFENISAQFK